MKALLSIKPEFAKAIFDGTKKFEYRKVIFKQNVQSVQVYVTKPVGKIIGEFEIEKILKDEPAKVWRITRKHSGIKESFYMKYFQDKSIAYAIKIKSAKRYKKPVCPYSMDARFVAPQSFKYVRN